MNAIVNGYESFVETLNSELGVHGIDRSELAMLDHLCYRVATVERYTELKAELTETEIYIGEAVVGGRSISTFEFHTPLKAGGWEIPYLELPEPKVGSNYAEGLQHAEFVVIGGLDRFAARHAELPFERKGMDKKLNPELGLKTKITAMKFHEQPLGAVVRIEQRLGL